MCSVCNILPKVGKIGYKNIYIELGDSDGLQLYLSMAGSVCSILPKVGKGGYAIHIELGDRYGWQIIYP